MDNKQQVIEREQFTNQNVRERPKDVRPPQPPHKEEKQ